MQLLEKLQAVENDHAGLLAIRVEILVLRAVVRTALLHREVGEDLAHTLLVGFDDLVEFPDFVADGELVRLGDLHEAEQGALDCVLVVHLQVAQDFLVDVLAPLLG